MPDSFEIECMDCGDRSSRSPLESACPRCGSEWLEARYDLRSLAQSLPHLLQGRPFDMWRYRELLPIHSASPQLTMGEGGTPLFPAVSLGMMLGLKNLYIKDERQGPSASFKDRQAALTVAGLKEAGHTEAVVASTGNVAISFSAYGARAGLKIWAFLTSLVPAAKMHEVALYGTQVIKITSTYDQAKQLAGQYAAKRGLYMDRGARSVLSVEAMKTIAFEIAEQLGALTDPEGGAWRAPDWYFQAVSGGVGPIGVQKGFAELKAMGLVDRIPALGLIQAEGCAPMAHAWKRSASEAPPVRSPTTHISTLSTGDPGRAYQLLRQRMLSHGGGAMDSVSDEDAFRAMNMVAKMEGLSVEPAVGVAFAGLIRLAHQGRIQPEDLVVVNCSGHTMPIEEELLQEGWLEDIDLNSGLLPEKPQEGLLAALARLDQRRTRQVLIVDDHPDARRLIRRVLQAQGSFDIREVSSGGEALDSVDRDPPDLIVLDLMMPEIDGFEVLNRLRDQPETRNVPVIVVTAKALTPEEKERLEGRISRLMLKGDFLTDDLLEEISKVLHP